MNIFLHYKAEQSTPASLQTKLSPRRDDWPSSSTPVHGISPPRKRPHVVSSDSAWSCVIERAAHAARRELQWPWMRSVLKSR